MRSIVQSYLDRARNHPKGRPDRIHITIEKLTQRPQLISTLPLVTLNCTSPSKADICIRRLLSLSGISGAALKVAFSVVRNAECMRGAALVYARSGRRVEPDHRRGVRASCLGITGGAEILLAQQLEKCGINTRAVKEALVLASKVAAFPDIIAELCISDDPDYTTGYIASDTLGYIRIPHIKKKQTTAGGRVFFLRERADISPVVRYLERIPVLVSSISPCRPMHTFHEIIDHHYR
jgi:6-carboxyhexanoate--CoA ligase